MSNWRKCKLSEVAVKFAMGPFGSNIKAENFTNTGVPVIRGTNLNYYRYVDGEFVYLTEEKANQLKSSNCFPGDIVITHRGTLGQVGLIPFGKHDRYVVSQSGMKVTVNPNFLDSNFLLYFFKSNIGQNELLQHESQVGVPSISNPLTSLKSVSLNLPPIEEQKAIASVLSSLDDKIDLLHRQNKTLEAMAETLFRQWFVEESEESSNTIFLGDIAYFSNGKSRPEEVPNGSVPIYGGNGILGYTNQSNSNGPSIIIGRVGAYCGSLFIENKPVWISDNAMLAKPINDSSHSYLFYLLKSLRLNEFAEGSSHPLLTQALLNSIQIISPSAEKISLFCHEADKWKEKSDFNQLQIKTLETLRDTLLPKLMSGEVRVDYP